MKILSRFEEMSLSEVQQPFGLAVVAVGTSSNP